MVNRGVGIGVVEKFLEIIPCAEIDESFELDRAKDAFLRRRRSDVQ
jgi:hypothetical protein